MADKKEDSHKPINRFTAPAGISDQQDYNGFTKFIIRKLSAPLRYSKQIITQFLCFMVNAVGRHFYSHRSRRWYVVAKSISANFLYPLSPRLHDMLFVKLKTYLKQQYLRINRYYSSISSSSLYLPFQTIPADYSPKVSVIVPNYNHSAFLRQRLESIYRQTYRNFEVILLDDASTDESIQILEEYAQCYPDITRCCFNEKNSGGVFNQWRLGFKMAQGDLVWIAESDDFCSENLLTELVRYFANEAVMFAYCRSAFVKGETIERVWSTEEYLMELDPTLWRNQFVMSAHQIVNKAWAVKNIVPNVSSAVFRHPGKLEILNNEEWQQMRICGDWLFYLHLIRGGLVAYNPNATNYYRLHQNNASVSTYNKDVYYQEHEKVAKELLSLYRLKEGVLERQRQILESHWRTCRMEYSKEAFKKCYDYERIRRLSMKRKPNLMMASFALAAGGGETFPIKLANMLKTAGYSITFLNCHQEPTEAGVRKMLRRDIPLLELDALEKLSAVVDDFGIELLHSHHAWVDINICTLMENNSDSKLIITTHGMYEMMPAADFAELSPILRKSVKKFVYTADKNLAPFDSDYFDMNCFIKIENALEKMPVTAVARHELGIPHDAFVICMVSRAIPEKGWQEAIESVNLACKFSKAEIHLLMIGEGIEYDRLKIRINDSHIHFLGFRKNIRDYFATSDLGFLPSRFRGESFPLVVIDCLHSNRPILASNVGEIAKMLETIDGPAGTVFELENWNIPVEKVAKIIVSYVQDKRLYLEHLRRVPMAVAKFDPAVLLKYYDAVYEEVFRGQNEGENIEKEKS